MWPKMGFFWIGAHSYVVVGEDAFVKAQEFRGSEDGSRTMPQIRLFARQLDERAVVEGSSNVRHTPKKKERPTSPRRNASSVPANTLPDLVSVAALVIDLYRSKVIAR